MSGDRSKTLPPINTITHIRFALNQCVAYRTRTHRDYHLLLVGVYRSPDRNPPRRRGRPVPQVPFSLRNVCLSLKISGARYLLVGLGTRGCCIASFADTKTIARAIYGGGQTGTEKREKNANRDSFFAAKLVFCFDVTALEILVTFWLLGECSGG